MMHMMCNKVPPPHPAHSQGVVPNTNVSHFLSISLSL
jgi:hypothetical protein